MTGVLLVGLVSMNWLLVNPENRDAKGLLTVAQEIRSNLDVTLNLYGSIMKAEVMNTGLLGVIIKEEFSDSSGAVSLVYSYASAPGVEDTLFLAGLSLVADQGGNRFRYDLACTGTGLYAWWQKRGESDEHCVWASWEETGWKDAADLWKWLRVPQKRQIYTLR